MWILQFNYIKFRKWYFIVPLPFILYVFVVIMPDVPFVASPALIHRHSLCLELRVLIEILPSIILRLVGLLSLP